MSQEPVLFPKDFKWCVATSAHQIEGYNTQSDWWDWEQTLGKIKNGDKSGAACDHWNRVAEDIDLLKNLNIKQYRFSIEWAKIEPNQDVWDSEAIAHYKKELQILSQAQIEPIITLHHFTLPRWFRKQGGWEWSEAPTEFLKYVQFVYKALGAPEQIWITFNEPMVHLVGGYIAGVTPPGEKRAISGLIRPLKGLLQSHALA
ncbi:MAG: glycoside hydrolase family 1 protein [Bdellovibrio sp.]|nr:glycoside hydrolase family 1 protein [Bdellovibrio sp.]